MGTKAEEAMDELEDYMTRRTKEIMATMEGLMAEATKTKATRKIVHRNKKGLIESIEEVPIEVL